MHEKKIRIAINGAGRIGRAFIRLAFNNPNIEFVAINDLGDIENIAYLMRYDTAYGVAPFEVKAKEDQTAIIVNGKEIRFLNEKDPALLPWQDLNVDIVIEATGVFTAYEKARDHITAGAKRVVITAPAKGEPKDETEVMVLMGINDEKLEKSVISSNASARPMPFLQLFRY